VERLGVTKSAISHQLRGLRDKRLIRTRKQGRNVFVCLDDDHVIELFKRGLDHVLHG
jgi:ArsR family transcriptional regulator